MRTLQNRVISSPFYTTNDGFAYVCARNFNRTLRTENVVDVPSSGHIYDTMQIFTGWRWKTRKSWTSWKDWPWGLCVTVNRSFWPVHLEYTYCIFRVWRVLWEEKVSMDHAVRRYAHTVGLHWITASNPVSLGTHQSYSKRYWGKSRLFLLGQTAEACPALC